MIKKAVLLIILGLIICQTHALLHNLNGMYIDRITIWDTNGPQRSNGTYNFEHNWRQTLPGVVTSGIALYNFKTGMNSILSYIIKMKQIDIRRSSVELQIVGVNCRLVYLAFSIIVETEQSNMFELLGVQDSNLREATYNHNYTLQSKKYNFSQDELSINYFHEWITGDMYFEDQSNNYWSWMKLTSNISISKTNNTQLTLNLQLQTSFKIYITGFKINILIVYKDAQAVIYQDFTKVGKYMKSNFQANFGINNQLYGQANCIHGLYVIDLQYTSQLDGRNQSYFIFNYTGKLVSNIQYADVWGIKVTSFCYGICGPYSFFNHTHCITCNTTHPFCKTCPTLNQCSQCLPGFTLTQSGVCSCPPRFISNGKEMKCQKCPFDCLTCDLSGNCLSCSMKIDFRFLNQTSQRCIPITGYFQSNKPVASKCPAACPFCVPFSSCSSVCEDRQFFNLETLRCDSCPFDCLTCDSQGNCLSCSEKDFRKLKIEGINDKRCVPIEGYFQTLERKCHKCQQGCIECLSQFTCQKCQSSLFLINGSCSQPQQKSNLSLILGSVLGVMVFLFILTLVIIFKLKGCFKVRNEGEEQIGQQRQREETAQVVVPKASKRFNELQEAISQNIQKDEVNTRIRKGNYEQCCAICCDQKRPNNVLLFCGHYYHLSCIASWIRSNRLNSRRCPIDKKLLVKQSHVLFCENCGKAKRYIKFEQMVQLNEKEGNRQCLNCLEKS